MRPGRPELSVIVPTDRFDTVRNQLAALCAQTVRDQLEIVIVTASPTELGEPTAAEGFHSVVVVEVERLSPLYVARAHGIRAARAPIVLISESHAYLPPGHCEAMIGAHRGPWAVVGPAMLNANPATMRSWVGLYMDYGPWVDARRAGETLNLAGHNSSYKRDVLLCYGDDLEQAMLSSVVRHAELRARGHRLYVEPAARTFHLNVSRPGRFLEERVVLGRVFAAMRSRSWSSARRALYAAGSPLIPLVRLPRIARDVRTSGHGRDLARLLPVLLLGLALSALGEGIGYAAGLGGALLRVNEMELHKERYVRPADHPSATGVLSWT